MQAVILAAGLGKMIGEFTENKPKGLLKIAGRELIYRNLKILKNLGIKEFIIVTNQKYIELYENFLKSHHFKYRLVLNHFPERGNGYSLYLAKDYVSEKFILLMSDHLYEEEFIKLAIEKEGLIIDKVGIYVNYEEATKVKVEDGKIKEIGKDLTFYDGFDTGFFILTPDIFGIVENLINTKETIELSEIIREAKLRVSEVNGYFWIDIDSLEDKDIKKLIII